MWLFADGHDHDEAAAYLHRRDDHRRHNHRAAPVSTAHTHWVGDGWIWDEDDHFYACAGEECGELLARAPHVIVDGACNICGYIPYLPEE